LKIDTKSSDGMILLYDEYFIFVRLSEALGNFVHKDFGSGTRGHPDLETAVIEGA
jgi:hypothetical protein